MPADDTQELSVLELLQAEDKMTELEKAIFRHPSNAKVNHAALQKRVHSPYWED